MTIKKFNQIFNSALEITQKSTAGEVDSVYKEMKNTVTLTQDEFEESEGKLNDEIEKYEEQIKEIETAISNSQPSIQETQDKIRDLKFTMLMEEKMTNLDEVLADLIREFRERKVEELNTYTLEWYNCLVSIPLFRDIRIDKENYRISVLPIQTIVEADDYKDIIKYASGGHETFIAIAERLALLEIFGTKFGIFDEITDNADKDNATNMIKELASSGEYLDQVIAVTHFEVGRKIAGNLVKIAPILDQGGKYTGWSKINN